MQPGPIDVLAIVLAGAAIAISLAGIVIPAFPGLVVGWAAMLVFGLVIGFDATGVVIMSVVTLLTIAAYVLMLRIPQRQAERRGASRSASVIGAVGAIIGFFVIPVVGFIIGGVGGVFGAELWRTRDRAQAWNATRGVILGFGQSALVQLGIGLVMAALFVTWIVIRFDFA